MVDSAYDKNLENDKWMGRLDFFEKVEGCRWLDGKSMNPMFWNTIAFMEGTFIVIGSSGG